MAEVTDFVCRSTKLASVHSLLFSRYAAALSLCVGMCRRGAFLFALVSAAASTSTGAPLSPAAAAAAAAAAALAGPVAFSLQVDPQKEVCLYENVKAGWEIDASALVYRGGQRE